MNFGLILKRETGSDGTMEHLAADNHGAVLAEESRRFGHAPLDEALQECPYRTLQERRNYTEVDTGMSVSRFAMCRAIAGS